MTETSHGTRPQEPVIRQYKWQDLLVVAQKAKRVKHTIKAQIEAIDMPLVQYFED